VFIAGTYTPFSVLLFAAHTTAIGMLSAFWGGAVWRRDESARADAPGWAGRAAVCFCASAWIAIFVLPDKIARQGGRDRSRPVHGRGVLYSVGASWVRGAEWPESWPNTFGPSRRVFPRFHAARRTFARTSDLTSCSFI